jgi:hypothetical protein
MNRLAMISVLALVGLVASADSPLGSPAHAAKAVSPCFTKSAKAPAAAPRVENEKARLHCLVGRAIGLGTGPLGGVSSVTAFAVRTMPGHQARMAQRSQGRR